MHQAERHSYSRWHLILLWGLHSTRGPQQDSRVDGKNNLLIQRRLSSNSYQALCRNAHQWLDFAAEVFYMTRQHLDQLSWVASYHMQVGYAVITSLSFPYGPWLCTDKDILFQQAIFVAIGIYMCVCVWVSRVSVYEQAWTCLTMWMSMPVVSECVNENAHMGMTVYEWAFVYEHE